MKKLVSTLMGLSLVAAKCLGAGETPRGTLLELHSCEVYAGGCVVSSEATTGGRYMLRAWQFTGGSFNGTDLNGLCIAALQSSSDNLAAPESIPGEAVVYLPSEATPSQRDALLGWLKSTQTDFKPSHLVTKTASLGFAKNASGYFFKVGDQIAVTTRLMEICDTGACGEALWYTPRSSTSVFAVEVTQSARVTEPSLKLKWTDAGKRNAFLAKFGDTSAKENYVTATELCGPSGKLF
jgi:hypothetical protein